jgi:predicted Ser/Thr protein kinase
VDDACPACGAAILEIDPRCGECGEPLLSEEVRGRIGTTVLEHYEITEVLGQGGMSVVYRGRHRITGQEVALKILPPELAAYGQVKERFLEEARALARLDHPNVVHLYNFGQDGACLVLAMQLVQGSTWERLIVTHGRLDWGTSARIALDVLRALELAHGRGIIHRDMKPSNVLVRPDGSALVMDFGIAKMKTSTRLTATGQTMGTVRYMSPEQVRGQEVDERTDIYSVAVTLYESLCGQTPFDGESHFEIMSAHLTTPPPPLAELAPGLPAALERLVMAGLAKEREERPGSAREMRMALEATLAGAGQAVSVTGSVAGSVAAPPVGRESGPDRRKGLAPATAPPQRPALWIALGLTALLAGVGGVLLVRQMGADGERAGGAGAGAGAGAAGEGTGPAAGGGWPEPHRLAGMDLAVDRRFDADRLRVLSVEERDLDRVRASVARARRDFAAFAAARGLTVAAQPLNVVIVPDSAMCDGGMYESGVAPAGCETADLWYRPAERTLFLPEAEIAFEARLAYSLAVSMCLHSDAAGCDAVAAQFREAAVERAPR